MQIAKEYLKDLAYFDVNVDSYSQQNIFYIESLHMVIIQPFILTLWSYFFIKLYMPSTVDDFDSLFFLLFTDLEDVDLDVKQFVKEIDIIMNPSIGDGDDNDYHKQLHSDMDLGNENFCNKEIMANNKFFSLL